MSTARRHATDEEFGVDIGEEIGRAEFDDLARRGEFARGPWISSPGDGPGEPHVPHRSRRVLGTLESGRRVWAGPARGRPDDRPGPFDEERKVSTRETS